MKNIDNPKQEQNLEDLLPEYNFDYTKARPNRFVSQANQTEVIVTLEADVAKVFKTSTDVNKALRAIISAMPEK